MSKRKTEIKGSPFLLPDGAWRSNPFCLLQAESLIPIGKSGWPFCIARGMISSGSVVPEKTSMGKYRMQAITLACFVSFATPPTSVPTESVEIIVMAQLPRKARSDPRRRIPHRSPARVSVMSDTMQ